MVSFLSVTLLVSTPWKPFGAICFGPFPLWVNY
jgi:hypothetical protein